MKKQVHNGLLIAIEGIDGSGKSSLARGLAELLSDYHIHLTKEPGGTPLGEKIREILLTQHEPICSKAEFLLFAANRAQHFEQVIIPALDNNTIVISDRMADSSLVYQGYARGLSLSFLTMVNQWAMATIEPDITFYLQIDSTTALQRIHKRNIPLTAFEKEHTFVKKTIDGFESLFASKKKTVVFLDANKKTSELAKEAYNHIVTILQAKK